MIINDEKITFMFIKNFNDMVSKHTDECLWVGDSNTKEGFKLLNKQKKEKIELALKYGVLEVEN